MNENQMIKVIIDKMIFDKVEYNLIEEKKNDIAGMTTARNSTFTLKPQEKDFDNMSNMLEFAKSTKSVIRLINPQKFPSDETYRVQNYTSDSDKDFLVIAVLS